MKIEMKQTFLNNEFIDRLAIDEWRGGIADAQLYFREIEEIEYALIEQSIV